MTWFAAMFVVVDALSGSIQQMHARSQKTAQNMEVDAPDAGMPAFRKDNYFLDINSWVTQDVREFPDSAGWRKMRAPTGSNCR